MSPLASIDRFWYRAAPAERVALLRIVIGLYSLGYLLLRFPALTNVADFHAAEFVPVGPVTLLATPLPKSVVVGSVLLAMLFGVAFSAGFRYRVSGPAFALLLLWVTSYRNSWGMKFHTENLMTLHVLVLAGARAADALSYDAGVRGAQSQEHGRYGWPLRALCLLTVTTYVLAGVAKLKLAGVDWLHGDFLRTQVAHDNLRKIELGSAHSPLGALLVTHSFPFGVLAWLTLALELGAPIALLGGRIAFTWAAVAWSFHVGVAALMAIVFPYQLAIVPFLPFFALERAVGFRSLWRRLTS